MLLTTTSLKSSLIWHVCIVLLTLEEAIQAADHPLPRKLQEA